MSMTDDEVIERILYMGVGRSGLENENSCIAKALREIKQYRVIGTVSEFRELKEKATAKEPRFYAHNYHCIECGNLVGNNEFKWQRFEYCDKCGQKLDWSEGKE